MLSSLVSPFLFLKEKKITIASLQGRNQIPCKDLLECQADASLADRHGATALHYAAGEDLTDIISSLIDANDDLDIDPNFNFSVLPQKCVINHTVPNPTRFSYFCKVPLLSNFNGMLEVAPWSCPFCKTTHGPKTECESAPLNSSWIPNSNLKFDWNEVHDIPSTVLCNNGRFELNFSMQLPL